MSLINDKGQRYIDVLNRKLDARQSNFELLRIVAMLMIVAFHYSVHGIQKCLYSAVAYEEWNAGLTFNKAFTCFFTPGGEVGVALFFLITGYFMIGKQHVSSVCGSGERKFL